jgi:hypothetical protein
MATTPLIKRLVFLAFLLVFPLSGNGQHVGSVAVVAVKGSGDGSFEDNVWQEFSPTIDYSGRSGGDYQNRPWTSACYEPVSKLMILFEGYVESGPYPFTIYSNSVWSYDAATNDLIALKYNHWWFDSGADRTRARAANATDPTPPDRHPNMACRDNELFFWGGLDFKIEGLFPEHPDDTWTFDVPSAIADPDSTLLWTELFPTTHPEPGIDNGWGAMVWDAARSEFVHLETPLTEYGTRRTFTFSPSSGEWTEEVVSPEPSFNAGGGNAMAYDSKRLRVWLFGAGNPYDSGGNQLWWWSGSAWTEVTEVNSPPSQRIYQGVVYDSSEDALIVVGGNEGGEAGSPVNDTWVYQFPINHWYEHTANSFTAVKFLPSIYDAENDVVVIRTGDNFWLFRWNPCGDSTSSETSVLTEPATLRPDLESRWKDPVVLACTQRITTDVTDGNDPVHLYSQLQAWNADNTRILLQNRRVIDATTHSLVRTVPSNIQSWRWSPTEANIVYGIFNDGTCKFVSYNLTTDSQATVHDFTEYANCEKDISWEEIGVDSTGDLIVVLEGCDTDPCSLTGREIFWYNITDDVAMTAVNRIDSDSGPCGTADWVASSPLGNYIVIAWGGGGETVGCSFDTYNLTGTRLGLFAGGHGHGDLIIDEDGTTQWYVDWSPDNSVGITGNFVKKNKLPTGHDDCKPVVSNECTGDTTAIVKLLQADWENSAHISCQAQGSGWCVYSTYWGDAAWEAMEQEVVQVFLDSTISTPHIGRLVHTRSDVEWVADNCDNNPISYWVQPHASARRDGEQIIYGSSWGQSCRGEAYVIDLQ